MDPERWSALSEILASTLSLKPGERAAFLDRACAGDASIRLEVESRIAASDGDALLDEHAAAGLIPEVPPAEKKLKSGDRLGRYRLLDELGSGAMGTICRAQDDQLGRSVALKVISNAYVGPVERSRFRQALPKRCVQRAAKQTENQEKNGEICRTYS
jgi:eukaryotic-like serine/threonine-protein kinase